MRQLFSAAERGRAHLVNAFAMGTSMPLFPTYDEPSEYRGYLIWYEPTPAFGRICVFQRETRDDECDPLDTARNSDEAQRLIDDLVEEDAL